MDNLPDGDIERMHIPSNGIPTWGNTALLIGTLCATGGLGYLWLLAQIYRVTHSPWGRRLTARWWARVLPVLAAVATGAAFLFKLPWLMTLPALCVLLAPTALWLFLRGHTRPGSTQRRIVHRSGMAMHAVTAIGMLSCVGSVMHGTLTGSDALFPLFFLSLMMMMFAHVPLLFSLRALSQFWKVGAGRPGTHISAVASALRSRGLIVQAGDRQLTTADGVLTVTMDVSRAPASIVIEQHIEGLPPGLTVRARQPGDEPGLDLGDPLLRELLVVTASDEAAARQALGGLHELLLANLHAWPGSALEHGRLRVEMTGPPFVPPGQVRQEQSDATGTVQALTSQLATMQSLVEALRPRLDHRLSARRPAGQPLSTS